MYKSGRHLVLTYFVRNAEKEYTSQELRMNKDGSLFVESDYASNLVLSSSSSMVSSS